MYKGKVDNWRVNRNNAYLIHCSLVGQKDRVRIEDANPLPFDENTKANVEDSLSVYEEAKRMGWV